MKALEILNNDNIFDDTYVSENNYKKLINEAIAELEALENINCESCNCYENKARCDECSVNFDNLWESK